MRNTYILPFLKSAAPLIAVSLLFSCNKITDNETAVTLQKVERHYSYGSAIRLKPGQTENDTNLSLYLKKLIITSSYEKINI